MKKIKKVNYEVNNFNYCTETLVEIEIIPINLQNIHSGKISNSKHNV